MGDGEDKPRVGLAVIITRQDKVLIGRRKGIRGGGLWAFPGGHLNYCESFDDCARREVTEETGLEVEVDKKVYAVINDTMPHDPRHYVILFVRALYKNGIPINKEPDKCYGWVWREWDKLPQPLFHGIQQLITQGYNPFEK